MGISWGCDLNACVCMYNYVCIYIVTLSFMLLVDLWNYYETGITAQVDHGRTQACQLRAGTQIALAPICTEQFPDLCASHNKRKTRRGTSHHSWSPNFPVRRIGNRRRPATVEPASLAARDCSGRFLAENDHKRADCWLLHLKIKYLCSYIHTLHILHMNTHQYKIWTGTSVLLESHDLPDWKRVSSLCVSTRLSFKNTCQGQATLWSSNMTVVNPPCVDDFPTKASIYYWGFPLPRLKL